MQDKLRHTIAESVGCSADDITVASTMRNTDGWDSLSHIRLIVAIEDAYGLKLDENDMIRMTSAKEIIEVLRNKGVQ